MCIEYSHNIVKKLVRVQPEPTMRNRTIAVDTNYLIQVNQRDLISMFFDGNYESTVQSKLKKQMARLFRDMISRNIDLYLSDLVMDEFVGHAPKNKELLYIYKQYIGVIYSEELLTSHFLHLAAAINSCIIETGPKGDIKDTYSYLLTVLAGIQYFVTEDKDVERVYNYLQHLKILNSNEQSRQIKTIKRTYNSLCRTEEKTFPIDNILHYFLVSFENLPIPISIEHFEDNFPIVLDKVETILWIFRTLKEIDRLMSLSFRLPQGWDEKIVAQARARITNIAHNLRLQNFSDIDAQSFHFKLVNEEKKWNAVLNDSVLAQSLNKRLEIFWSCTYDETLDGNLEETFRAAEFEKDMVVECRRCGRQHKTVIHYEGVVGQEERRLGVEHYHKWWNQILCPCSETLGVEVLRYEYPPLKIYDEDIECFNCKNIRKITRVKVPSLPPAASLIEFLPKTDNTETEEE